MKLTAICPCCSHEFCQDSGYLGIKRTCPKCDEKFIFEIVDSDDEHPLSADEFGGKRIACNSCFRISTVKKHYVDMEMVPCGFCDSQLPIEFGKQFVSTVEAADQIATQHFLEGHAHDQLSVRLVSAGLGEHSAVQFALSILNRIPFIRYDVISRRNDLDIAVEHAFNCDLCSAVLHGSRYTFCHLCRVIGNHEPVFPGEPWSNAAGPY